MHAMLSELMIRYCCYRYGMYACIYVCMHVCTVRWKLVLVLVEPSSWFLSFRSLVSSLLVAGGWGMGDDG